MHAYSLELTIDGAAHAAKVFHAVKQFDNTVVMGTALERIRNGEPFFIELDHPERPVVLRRLASLLDELENLHVRHEITANNVPRTSHLWKPVSWERADVDSALNAALENAAHRAKTAEISANQIPIALPPSRELFEYRWAEMEFTTLLIEEQRYIHIWAMRAEVYNGGFGTYFYNSAGDTALETHLALEFTGCSEIRRILELAIGVLDEVEGYSNNRQIRTERLAKLPDNRFLELNTRFYDANEDAVSLAFAIVETTYLNLSMI